MESDLEPPKLSQKAEPILVRIGLFQPKCAFPFLMGNGTWQWDWKTLDFIQCPFPNQIQFGLEKLQPKIAYNFPNQFQFGLERKKLILQDTDSKPNSDWFGKIINY